MGQESADRGRRPREVKDRQLAARAVASIEQLEALLARQLYIADRGLATSIYLALTLQRPLLLEGEAGVGKTEVAKVLASGLGTKLIRLQCYEGLDISQAVYEWNYAAPAPRNPADGGRRRRRSRTARRRSSSARSS